MIDFIYKGALLPVIVKCQMSRYSKIHTQSTPVSLSMKLFRDCLMAIFGAPSVTRNTVSKISQVAPLQSPDAVIYHVSEVAGELDVPPEPTKPKFQHSIDSIISSSKSSDKDGQDDKNCFIAAVEHEFFQIKEKDNWKKVRFEVDHLAARIRYPGNVDKAAMMESLFDGNRFPSSSVIDLETLTNLFIVITFEKIIGPLPCLPFTEESFPVYLFQECRDLNLVLSLLQFCKSNPMVLRQIERKLRDSADSVSLRDFYMLPFLLRIQLYEPDPDLTMITLHLMGFSNMINLKLFYEDSPDDRILRLIDNFDWTLMDRAKCFSSAIYGYTNDLF